MSSLIQHFILELVQLFLSPTSLRLLLASNMTGLFTFVLRLLMSRSRKMVSQLEIIHNFLVGPLLLHGMNRSFNSLYLRLVVTAILFVLVGFLDPDHAVGLGERALKLLDSSILFTVFLTLVKSKPVAAVS